jgi:hypothetical protein
MDLSIKYIQESKVPGNYCTVSTDDDGLFPLDYNYDKCTQIL